jgi:hypothetical protein
MEQNQQRWLGTSGEVLARRRDIGEQRHRELGAVREREESVRERAREEEREAVRVLL